MQPLLYLAHRIPYPPNKGDKVRSYHLLRFLADRYSVHLGTFIDDPADRVHAERVAALCASCSIVTLRPPLARLRSMQGLLRGEALSVPYYRDATLTRWVRETVEAQRIARAVVFSSAMAQYVAGLRGVRTVVDFVDVDSAKWDAYADARRGPLAWLYRREGDRLLAYERAVARAADASVFVTPSEAELFRRKAPESAARVAWARNGVDTAYFAPDAARASPYADGEDAVVFTGAMDYWPNVDAVEWFARDVFPRVAQARPRARFWIVGMNPAPRVRALARDARVTVTGRVADVRPYLQHASVVVAPLRVARGIQNKVLEAMAMSRPVVTTPAVGATLGADAEAVTLAATADDFTACTTALLDGRDTRRIGAAARDHVVREYDWNTNLALFAAALEGAGPSTVARPAPAPLRIEPLTHAR